jgi:PDZ domain-containing protein
VVPREFVYPPGDSTEEVQRRNEERKVESENAATLAALNHLDLPYTTSVRVQRVEPGLPADGALQRDDQITAVDGKPVSTSQGLRDAISPRPPGSQVTLSLVRGGQAREAVLTTARPESGEERSIVGVIAAEIPDYGFEISITLQNVGGPSAGLMFALGIIDKLGPESVTGGRFVAGTGEIRSDGTVGPIGGIQQKLVAARARGADVFLVPDANCPEARERAPDGLRLVRVATLDEAVERLRALDEGGDPPTC